MPYIFDTNSIAALSHYYPKRFPTFWTLFDAAVDAEEVISVREVSKELITTPSCSRGSLTG